MDVDHLESIAQQLVARVRDDDPEANGRWLATTTTDEERWALIWMLAAAASTAAAAGRTWRDLTEWTRTPEEIELQKAMRRQALINATARANGAGRRRAA